jgi:hypothetical protein
MAWVTPTNVATGDVLTASNWNQSVVENTEFLFTPPMCRVYRATTSGSMSTNAAVSWTAQIVDTDDMWEGVTNPSRITINTAGVYAINGSVRMDTTGAYAQYNWFVRKNGTAQLWQAVASFTGAFLGVGISAVIDLSAGDYIELITGHSGTGTFTVYGDSTNRLSNLSAVWVGDV